MRNRRLGLVYTDNVVEADDNRHNMHYQTTPVIVISNIVAITFVLCCRSVSYGRRAMDLRCVSSLRITDNKIGR